MSSSSGAEKEEAPPPPPPPPLTDEELHQQQQQQLQRHQRAQRKRAERRVTVAMKASNANGTPPPLPSSNGEVSSIDELQAMLRNFTQTAPFDDSIVKSSSTPIGAQLVSTRLRSATLSGGDVFSGSASSTKEHHRGERKSRKSHSRTGSRQSSRQHSPERSLSSDAFSATTPNLARPLSPFDGQGARAPPPPASLPAKPAPPPLRPPGSPQNGDAARKLPSVTQVNSADALVPRLSFRAPTGAAPPRPDDAARTARSTVNAAASAAAATPSSLLALSLSPRGVVNAKQVVADALDSHSGEPVEVGGGGGGNGGDSLRRASSSVEVLKDTLGSDQVPLGAAAGTKQSSKRHCMLCRQRFASAVALNQHIKQQHQCAQCGEIARVAYRVDADGAARRLCSRCAVAELLAAAQPGAPRVLRDMPPSPNHGIIPIAPVAPLSPRSAYVQAVLQARVRAASRGTSPEREPSPSKHETSSLNSSGGVANPRARRNTKTQHLRRGSHDIARSAPTTPTTPTTTAGTTPTTPTTTTPTTPTTTGDVPPPLPPDQIRADDDRFVAEPPPPLLPNPTIQAARMEQQEQEEEE